MARPRAVLSSEVPLYIFYVISLTFCCGRKGLFVCWTVVDTGELKRFDCIVTYWWLQWQKSWELNIYIFYVISLTFCCGRKGLFVCWTVIDTGEVKRFDCIVTYYWLQVVRVKKISIKFIIDVPMTYRLHRFSHKQSVFEVEDAS